MKTAIFEGPEVLKRAGRWVPDGKDDIRFIMDGREPFSGWRVYMVAFWPDLDGRHSVTCICTVEGIQRLLWPLRAQFFPAGTWEDGEHTQTHLAAIKPIVIARILETDQLPLSPSLS